MQPTEGPAPVNLVCGRCDGVVPAGIVHGFTGSILAGGKEHKYKNAGVVGYLQCPNCFAPICQDCLTKFGMCRSHPEIEYAQHCSRMRRAALQGKN